MFWVALYNDNTFLSQFDAVTKEENKYTDIDRSKLKEFCIADEDNPIVIDGHSNARLIVSIVFERPTQKLIYRRRTFLTGGGKVKAVVYLAGWHENINGVSVKSICYVYPDGHIEMAGAREDAELISCEE